MSEGYRTFDHTADLGLEVWADTPERLFALAAVAVLAQVAEAPPGEVEVSREVSLEAEDAGDLLVHWLNTALLEGELMAAFWTRAEVRGLSARALSGVLEGQRRDPRRQVFLREIKAVSHHDLELVLDPPRCRCRLVLDL
jgi:protein archease